MSCSRAPTSSRSGRCTSRVNAHAWAAVWLPGDVWLPFDPTNNKFVDERHVSVAFGRDYEDVPPLRGVIYTDSSGSKIGVSVDVAPLD